MDLFDTAPLTPALSRRERELTEVSGVVHRPEKNSRLWIRSRYKSVDLFDAIPLTPALSQRERAGVRCLVLYIDLKDCVDYGFGEKLSSRRIF